MTDMVTAMVSRRFAKLLLRLPLVALVALAASCGAPTVEEDYPDQASTTARDRFGEDQPGIFGKEGLLLFGKRDDAGPSASPIAVNVFLWRASLDTLSFMPLSSADAFGGVIITDWYVPPETPDHRFKMNVYILDRRLRADGIRVALFHQRRDGPGNWVDAEANNKTATELEDAILTRARQLRIKAASR
jgi:hypothetical protein